MPNYAGALGFCERVVLGGGLNLILTVITAFAFPRKKRFSGKKSLYVVSGFAMLFGASLVPWYFVIKARADGQHMGSGGSRRPSGLL